MIEPDYKLGDRVWYSTEAFGVKGGRRRATVIGFDDRWGHAITIRIDGAKGSVTTYHGVIGPMSILDRLAEEV